MSNNLRTLKHYYNTVKQNRNHRILRRTFNKTQNNNNQLFLDKFDNVYKKSFDEPQEIDNDILSKLITNLNEILYFLKKKKEYIDAIIEKKQLEPFTINISINNKKIKDKEIIIEPFKVLDLFSKLKTLVNAGNLLKLQLEYSLMLNISHKEHYLHKLFKSIYVTIESFRSYFENKYYEMFPITLALNNIGNNTFKLTNNNSFRRKKSDYITNEKIIKNINFKLYQLILKISDTLDKDIDILKKHKQKKHKSTKKYNNPNIAILQQIVNDHESKIKKQFEDFKKKIEEITLESTNNIPYSFDITLTQQATVSNMFSVYTNSLNADYNDKQLNIIFWNSIYLINNILRGGAKTIELENFESFIIELLRILANLSNKVRNKYLFEICKLVLEKLKSINLTDRYYLKNDIIENLLPYYNELSEEKPYCKINFNSFLIELQKNIYSDMLYQNANDKIMYSIKLNSDLMHKAKYFDICAHNKKTSSPPGTYGFTPTPARVPTIYGFESLKEETNI